MQVVRERLEELLIRDAIKRGHYDWQKQWYEESRLPIAYYQRIPGLKLEGTGIRLDLRSLVFLTDMLNGAVGILTEMFQDIPPEKILKNFGPEVLWYTLTQYDWNNEPTARAKAVLSSAGIDYRAYSVSHRTILDFEKENYNSGTVRATYDVVCGLGLAINAVELLSILPRATSRTDIQRFSIRAILDDAETLDCSVKFKIPGKQYHDIAEASAYLDAKTGVLLMHDGTPSAFATFHPSVVSNRLMIVQLQGITPKVEGYEDLHREGSYERATSPKGLFNLDWKKALVDVCKEIAERLGFARLGIQSAGQNKWTKAVNRKGEIALPIDRAKKIYDETARRLGFRLGENGIWVKDIAARKMEEEFEPERKCANM